MLRSENTQSVRSKDFQLKLLNRKEKHMTARDLGEGLADTVVEVHSSTDAQTAEEAPRGKQCTYHLKYAKQHLNKPDSF